MAPKKAARREQEAALPPRPQTPNDLAIRETEKELGHVDTAERKWAQRQQHSQESNRQTTMRTLTVETAIAMCSRMLRELDDMASQMLQPPRPECEDPKKKPPRTAEAQGMCEEVAVINQILHRFYRFDFRPDAHVRECNRDASAFLPKLKHEARQYVEMFENPRSPRRGTPVSSVKNAPRNFAELLPTHLEEVPYLPQQKGIDRGIWEEMLQMRGKRILVKRCIDMLTEELDPLRVRIKGLSSMADVSCYALSAVGKERQALQDVLRQQDKVRQEEIQQWQQEVARRSLK